jgi:hypothetical protein
MPRRKSSSARDAVISCALDAATATKVETLAAALQAAAPGLAGRTASDLEERGLFGAAIEKLRGRQAASMGAKQRFLQDTLSFLRDRGKIREFEFTGGRDRHDYRVRLNDGKECIFEAKGCLDGNNTAIWTRPANADEFIIWSLCQNAGADPRKNAWSGIHTRIGGTIVAERTLVDGLIIWDMVCATEGRPCPKLVDNPSRSVTLLSGRSVPPPCLYLFPRTVPDARNNPRPPSRRLHEVGLLQALYDAFGCNDLDVIEVGIEVEMKGVETFRRTILQRSGVQIAESGWTKLRRAKQ